MTERGYIADLARQHRATSVQIAGVHGDPKYLVEQAVVAKRYEKPDATWCVFDADEHPRLHDAIVQARDNGIGIALSNPCFELWLLLHFVDHRGYIDRDEVRRRVRDHLPEYQKAVPFEQLPPYDEARERALRLHEMHDGNDSWYHENPSSGMWGLIDAVEACRPRDA